jgi:S1-C subfamily serine protease
VREDQGSGSAERSPSGPLGPAPTHERPPFLQERPASQLPPPVGSPPAPAPPPATPSPPLPPALPLHAAGTRPLSTRLPSAPPTFEPGSAPTGGLPRLPSYARAPERSSPRWLRLLVAVALASAIVAAVVTASAFVVFDRPDAPTSANPPSNRLAGGSTLDIGSLLAKAQPSVVTIHTEEPGSSGLYAGAGTGVVVSEDGSVVTNAHVIERARALRVTLHDGVERRAQVVGSFPEDDVALVQIEGASGLVPAELGSSGDVRVGDDVVAIGNALNLGASPSVTQGIVSALDRSIEAPTGLLQNLIQTDAAINRGNSGGPLLNAAGEVIGLNTAIAADAQNIGFAIPIDQIKPLIDDLRDGLGRPPARGGFLGVRTMPVADVPQEILDEHQVSASRGAFVAEVLPGTAAEAAGFREGDVIVAVDGSPVSGPSDLGAILRDKAPGETVTVSYERAGRREHLEIDLGEG